MRDEGLGGQKKRHDIKYDDPKGIFVNQPNDLYMEATLL